MFHLILADAEIELIPMALRHHPAVRKHAERRKKKPKNMLLDASFHHSAIKKFYPREECERRGRPDIAHIFCNLAQESFLCQKGYLRTYIHTRNDDVIYIDPKTHLPKAYHRFVGLIESVYNNKYVPSKEEPLLYLKKTSLVKLIKSIKPVDVVVFDNSAEKDFKEISKEIETKAHEVQNLVFVIGGFPHGDFISDLSALEHKRARMGDISVPAYVIEMEVITFLERAIKII